MEFFKLSFLNRERLRDFVGQFMAKLGLPPEQKQKVKEEYLKVDEKTGEVSGYAVEFSNIVDALHALPNPIKTEKLLLLWLMDQTTKSGDQGIQKSLINTDQKIIKENLQLYFDHIKDLQDKNIFQHNYSDLKEWLGIFRAKDKTVDDILGKPYHQSGGYKIWKILDYVKVQSAAQGTGWCVRGEMMAKNYLAKGPIYFVTLNDEKFAMINFAQSGKHMGGEGTMFDIMDTDDIPLKIDVMNGIMHAWPELKDLVLECFKLGGHAGNLIKYIENPTKDQELFAVKEDPAAIEYIKEPTDEMQDIVVVKNPATIKKMKNPSPRIQMMVYKSVGKIKDKEVTLEDAKLAALKVDGSYLENMVDPTDEMKLTALKQNGHNIKFIKNPSVILQRAAVQASPDYIRSIDNPSEEIELEAYSRIGKVTNVSLEDAKMAALKRDGTYITNMKNPTETMKLTAVKQRPYIISEIKGATEDMMLIAVGYQANLIEQMVKSGITPTKRVQIAVVTKDPRLIKFIKKPCDEAKLIAVQGHGHSLRHIKNPSNEIKLESFKAIGKLQGKEVTLAEAQLAAVKQNGMVLGNIENPTEEMKEEALKKDGYAIRHIQNPSVKLQLIAINENPHSIVEITPLDRPIAEEVQLAVLAQDDDIRNRISPEVLEKFKNMKKSNKSQVFWKNANLLFRSYK